MRQCDIGTGTGTGTGSVIDINPERAAPPNTCPRERLWPQQPTTAKCPRRLRQIKMGGRAASARLAA